ncbi:MAG: glycosyltransferase [Bacteroidetes bacterium]|nr:glycosyltransferase [Bacteroidota bacterium]
MDISVVIPVVNEEESLQELTQWISKVLVEQQFTYEIILIDDGSTDRSWEVIRNISQDDNSVKAIKFTRNYGKAAGLYCGFEKAQGEVIITMDGDLQDNPEEIPALYKMVIDEGYDLVSGWKKKRYDPVFTKNIPSKFYNWTVRKISKIRIHDMNCGLKAYRQKVVKSIEVYGEMHRYIPVLAKWAGFHKIGEKVVQHQERKYGKTKYGLERFIRGPLDLLSVMFISKFGKSPMHFFGTWGTLVFILGFAAALYVGVNKLYRLKNGLPTILVTQSPYFYIALVLMIIGVQLFTAGFLGDLISRKAPNRNEYTIDEEI